MKRRETYQRPAWSEKRKDRLAVTIMGAIALIVLVTNYLHYY